MIWTSKRLDELEANLPPLIKAMDWETCRSGHTRYELAGLVEGFPFITAGGECRRCKQTRGRETQRRKRSKPVRTISHRYRGEGIVLGEVKIGRLTYLEVEFERVDFDGREGEIVLVPENALDDYLQDELPFKSPPLDKYLAAIPGQVRTRSRQSPEDS